MDSRRLRLSALVIIVMTALLGVASPAYAGTLTSASFTSSTAYTYTNAQNTNYDWGFTTATTSTLSKVTATVPAGTGGDNRYLALNGENGNGVTTPDSVANSITGDFDIRVKAQMADWRPYYWSTFAGKADGLFGSDVSWWFGLNRADGTLFFDIGTGPGSFATQDSTAAIPSTNGQPLWLRATAQPNTPTGDTTVNFYTSTDGSSWSALGTSRTATGVTALHDSNEPLQLGCMNSSCSQDNWQGRIYDAELRNGVSGTVVNKFDSNYATPTQAAAGSWASSSGETWTVNRNGTNQPADIATDLRVGLVTGVPNGGTADYRFIDGAASYYFPTATSVSASTPCTINLGGFINTAIAGSYSSAITTWDDSGTPALVDSTTTPTLAFTDYSSSLNITGTIDPMFTFAVANQSSACNGESNFVSTAGAATAVALGRLAVSSNISGGQALSVTSNAGNGFAVYVRGTQSAQNLRSTGYNWTDVTGTYASPAALGADERFGYTYKDSTTSSSVSNPTSATFVRLNNATINKIMGSTTSMSGSGCVSFDAQTGAATPTGSYAATVVYTAVPTF